LFVAVGDVDGDTVPDVVVANQGSFPNYIESVGVLVGNGDGTFQAPRNFYTGGTPCSVAVGDVNGDGHLDIAVANDHGNNVTVLLGNGDGTFPATRNFPVGRAPVSVAVGDFNRDGVPDLVTANSGSDNVSVLLGNGDGTFQPARNFPAGSAPSSVVVGDVNGDGLLDLIAVGYLWACDYYTHECHVFDETVRVLLGNGDGTFQPARDFPAGDNPRSVALGDFNGDGHPDVVVANYLSNNVSLLLGNGDGTFQPPRNFPAGRYPYSVAVGDFNGDGFLDLAVANVQSNNLSVLLGNGDGTFQPARNFPAAGTSFVTVADINRDGILDLVTTSSVLLGNGDGTFQSARNFSAGRTPVSVAVADVNGDGLPDLAVTNLDSGTVTVLLGNGDGTFQTAPVSYVAGGFSVAIQDFNGDGWPDLAVASSGPYYGPNYISILDNDGDWPNRPHGPPGSPREAGKSAALFRAATHNEPILAPLFSAGASRTFPTVQGELDARTAAALLGEVERTGVDQFFASPCRQENWPVPRRLLRESMAWEQSSLLEVFAKPIFAARLAMIPGLT
jgi:hypothetical protein